MNIFKSFQHWNLILWFIWIAAFFALEGIGLARRQDATFTAIIRSSIPRWVIACLLGWLTYHFMIQGTTK